jgi:hypothetical protein
MLGPPEKSNAGRPLRRPGPAGWQRGVWNHYFPFPGDRSSDLSRHRPNRLAPIGFTRFLLCADCAPWHGVRRAKHSDDASILGPHHLASQPVATSGRSITFRAQVSAARTTGQNDSFFRLEHVVFGETRRIKSPGKRRRAITSLDRSVASTILNQCEARLARSLLFNQKESPCRSTDCAHILPGLPPAS